jgi:hypothetical protein
VARVRQLARDGAIADGLSLTAILYALLFEPLDR